MGAIILTAAVYIQVNTTEYNTRTFEYLFDIHYIYLVYFSEYQVRKSSEWVGWLIACGGMECSENNFLFVVFFVLISNVFHFAVRI